MAQQKNNKIEVGKKISTISNTTGPRIIIRNLQCPSQLSFLCSLTMLGKCFCKRYV